MSSITWQMAPASLLINAGEIHIWRASLQGELAPLHVLSAQEQQRGARLLRPEHRRRFYWAHIHLRRILSHYIAIPPEQFAFGEGSHGKPYLQKIPNTPFDLRFNLSHSGDQALYAIALNHEVGIDIERLDPNVDVLALAARFFSASENQYLLALPPSQHLTGFFHIWARKEAYIKAIGAGLSCPLREFSVLEEKVLPNEMWSLMDMQLNSAYAAALAMQTDLYQPDQFRFFDNTPASL